MNRSHWTIVALVALLAVPAACQDEGVSLTVYNGNFGVVREARQVEVSADGLVKFTDVAAQIDPTTVRFKSLTDPSAKLLEQNFQYDLVSADKLLRKYVDQPIEIVAEGHSYAGTLLSFDGQHLVIKEAEGIVMVRRPDNIRDIRFKVLPEGLLTRPTLIWQVATNKPGKQLVEVTYQTGAINWHAEYVLVLDKNDSSADLSGWVSVDNRSGKTYRNAKLKFIAGDVRRIQPRAERGLMKMAYSAPAAAPMAEKAFFEYHMYTLQRPSTVADNETKQLEMFTPAKGVKITKRLLYNPLGNFRWGRGGRYTDRNYGATQASKKVNVFIEFKNTKANKLGIPLPAGKVRVYKQDPADKALEFVGEELIDHTPKDEKLSLLIGNAFDVVGERRQVVFQSERGRRWMKETIEIKLRNHKDQDVEVRIKEPLYRWTSGRVTASSAEYSKLDARTIAFDVAVKANGETVVTYTVEYTW